MKTTKLYAKKTLSVFMAVMMLMTAWVFVAPEKAEAAGESYYIEVVWSANRTGQSDALADDGNDSGDCIGFFIKTKDNHGTGTEYTYTADLKGKTTNTDTTWSQTVTGFPTSIIAIVDHGWATQTAQLDIKSIKIGKDSSTLVTVFNGVITLKSSTKFKRFQYNVGNSSTSNDSSNAYLATANSATWAYPKVSAVVSNPTAQTVTVQKTGISNAKSFTATYKDQYGVTMAGSGATAAFDPALTGASITMSGNTATVTAGLNVFNNLTNYSTSTGKGTRTLKITNNGVVASCTVTFQAPKFNLKFNNIAGTTVYTSDLYYKAAVDCASIASGLANSVTQIADNNNQHQTYVWDTTTYVTSLTADTVVTEVSDKLADHTYGDWTQNEADHTRTCSDCGYVHTQAHINGTGYVTKEETCTEDGVMTYDCAVCGKTAIATSVINNISGHSFTGDPVENVTGENGNHWKKCARCDVYGWGTTENACEAHVWDKNTDGVVNASDAETKASTCKDAGYEKYTCQVCSATWTKTLDLADHKTTAHKAVDVANVCGGEGNIAYWDCSVCGRVWTDSALANEISNADADGDNIPDAAETYGPAHVFDGEYKSVTNGKDGTHNRRCTICQNAYGLDGVKDAAEAHTWGEPTVTDASCTKEGSKVYECTAAGCTGTYTETIAKVAHSTVEIPAVDAACGKAGNNKYYQCSVCKSCFKDAEATTETTVAAETIPALVHTWTAHHDYDTLKTAATCQSAAVYNNHCDYCKVQLAGATHSYGDVDKVNGHKFNGDIKDNKDGTHSYACTVSGCTEYGVTSTCNYEVTADIASTCNTKGYTSYECTECGNGYSVQKELDPANHAGTATKTVNQKDATCATDGYTGDIYYACCYSEAEGADNTSALKEEGTVITADKTLYPHENAQTIPAKASTCQTAGYNKYEYCDKCDTYITEKVAVEKKAHKFTTYTSNGDGTHTAECDTCDATVAEKATDTNNCSGGTANCVDKAVCTVCKEAYGDVNSANHKETQLVTKVDSTCQKEGHEAYRHCNACNTDVGTITPIAKKEHVYGAWTQNADGETHTRACTTCDATVADVATESGICQGGTATCQTPAKCADCGGSYGELDAATHETQAATFTGYVAATCTAPGYTGDRLYNCCNAVKEKGTAIAQLEHKYTVEVEGSRTAATCIEDGEVTFKCETCDATKKETLTIDPRNHASTETILIGKVEPTCETDGYSGDEYHKCCYSDAEGADNKYALISKGSAIEANGQHVFGTATPEYMLVKETDADGKVTYTVKTEEPTYEEKIAARHADTKWYHSQTCEICDEVVFSACYTYKHTYNCVDTDICEICSGLCSLINENVHKNDLVKVEGVKATCQKEGISDYYKCEACEETYLDAAGKTAVDVETDDNENGVADALELSKTGHDIDWSKPTEEVAGTCGTEGSATYKCKNCDYEEVINTGYSSDSHTWKTEAEIITEPTCGNIGYKAILCEVCEENGKISVKPNSYEPISATGEHDYELIDSIEGSSCKDPTIETYKCKVCGDQYTIESEEGVSAHQWGEWVTTGGDCSTGVIQIRSCTVCSAQEQKVVSTGIHELIVKVRVEPTCEEEGYIIRVCKNCGFEDEKEILPVDSTIEGHEVNTDYYKTVSEATCTLAEQREYTCIHCGEKVVKAYGEMLDHVWLTQAAEVSTCDRAGHDEYYRCVRCLEERGRVNYPANGHNDADGDNKCDDCSKVFYEEGTKQCGCLCHKEGWLMKLIYKIVCFFWKLFKISPSCACGAVHY